MSRPNPQTKSTRGRSPGTAPPAVEPQGRRQHARLDVRMSAEIRTARAVFTATTRDLSEAGAGLELDRTLSEGEEIALGLFLVVDDLEEETPPLWVKARVAWTGETDSGAHTAGVRFAVITPEQQAWLRQILSHVQPQAER
jgi:c-di-GMP-binding flagellar brake protein YcgR